MMILMILAAAAASSGQDALPAQPSPPLLAGEARAVLARQFASPPRGGNEVGLSAEEADAVMARYIASIGAKLDRAEPVSKK